MTVSFLQNRTIKFVLDGQFSTPHDINTGVLQGLVLGPTLFLVYINNLPDGALQELEFMQNDTTAYAVLPRANCCLLIAS